MALTVADANDAVITAKANLRSALGGLDEREPHAFDYVLEAVNAYGQAQWTAGYVLRDQS